MMDKLRGWCDDQSECLKEMIADAIADEDLTAALEYRKQDIAVRTYGLLTVQADLLRQIRDAVCGEWKAKPGDLR